MREPDFCESSASSEWSSRLFVIESHLVHGHDELLYQIIHGDLQICCPRDRDQCAVYRASSYTHRSAFKAYTWTKAVELCLVHEHDNVIYLDSMLWNWSRSIVCNDAIFMASCVNEAIAHEIWWPSIEERRAMAAHIPQLQGCIGFVDKTLVCIHHTYKNEHHSH